MELRGWKRPAFWNLKKELHSRPHFLRHLLCFVGNFSGFSERVFKCCCLVAKKVREKEMTKILLVGFQEKARKDKKMNEF